MTDNDTETKEVREYHSSGGSAVVWILGLIILLLLAWFLFFRGGFGTKENGTPNTIDVNLNGGASSGTSETGTGGGSDTGGQ